MGLQSNINQGISIASFLYSQSPSVRAKAQETAQIREGERELEKMQKTRDLKYKTLTSDKPYIETGKAGRTKPAELRKTAEELGEISEIDKGIARTAENILDIDPTEERYKRVAEAKEGRQNIEDVRARLIKSAEKKEERARLKEKQIREAEAMAQETLRLEQERNERTRQFYNVLMQGASPSYNVRETIRYEEKEEE